MEHGFKEFEKYINDRIESTINEVLQATRTNVQANMFLAKFARAQQNSRVLREKSAQSGLHIPPILIADIENKEKIGNTQIIGMKNKEELITEEGWLDLFEQADQAGVAFIVLRGSDPLLSPKVIKGAGKFSKMMFPFVMDGSRLEDHYVKFLDKHRNLLPIFRLRGGNIFKEIYETRGIYMDYDPVVEKMDALAEHHIMFGAVVHVNLENLDEVTRKEYLNKLYDRGCRIVFYINYVPERMDHTMLEEEEDGQKYLKKQLEKLQEQYMGMLLYQIPEDEKAPGGCLAAARGFMHITAVGDVQPCPVCLFHDRNIRVHSLKESAQSTFFQHLHQSHLLEEGKEGVCPLAGKEAVLKLILR